MSSQKLNIYLNALGKNPEYKAIFSHANQLNQIEHILVASAVIPSQLLAHCKIGPLCRNQLVLLAENASIAAKLKHIAPSIINKLHKNGWKIDLVKVQVQNPGHIARVETSRKNESGTPRSGISGVGIESLNRFAKTLRDSELKDCIARLIKNQS